MYQNLSFDMFSTISWPTDFLTDRTQFSVVNGQHSTVLNVTCGIPQGSVLGPTLFALYTNDLPSAVTSGSVFMYADDTTVYCIGDTVDNTVTSLNKALSELNSWCLENSLTPDSAKCEAMLLMRKPHIGPLNSVTIGEDRIEWVKHSRLLGVTITRSFLLKTLLAIEALFFGTLSQVILQTSLLFLIAK